MTMRAGAPADGSAATTTSGTARPEAAASQLAQTVGLAQEQVAAGSPRSTSRRTRPRGGYEPDRVVDAATAGVLDSGDVQLRVPEDAGEHALQEVRAHSRSSSSSPRQQLSSRSNTSSNASSPE